MPTSATRTDREYRPGDPVRVRVARRERRLTVTDDGAAVRRAGRPPGWRAVGSALERELDVNITRQGVVWLPVVAAGPGEAAVVRRIEEASLTLYQELLDLEG
ncbi:MAG TPA: hypothetical protein VHX62_01780 [Solirubrobacteraceae bacterium]|nr:hypothetical protein [Solirubrobacteraceae bacterium]